MEFKPDFPTLEERRLMNDVEGIGRALADEHNKVVTLRARLDSARELILAIGGMPDGFCVCFNSVRDPLKPEHEHTGECRDLRTWLAEDGEE